MASAVYRATISFADRFVPQKLRPLWEHPAGPKTVFFWSPLFKWVCHNLVFFCGSYYLIIQTFISKGLVLAGIGDMNRPVEKVSIRQSGALAATGFIWSRYSLVIIPKNWSLFSVNLFVGLTNVYQLIRVMLHKNKQKAIAQ